MTQKLMISAIKNLISSYLMHKVPMTDPAGAGIYANIFYGADIDGIHGAPYIAIYSSTMDPMG